MLPVRLFIDVKVIPGSPLATACIFIIGSPIAFFKCNNELGLFSPIPTLPVIKLNSDAANCKPILADLASFKADNLNSPPVSSTSKLWSVLVLTTNLASGESVPIPTLPELSLYMSLPLADQKASSAEPLT